jgi:hypothetical protein
MTANAGLLTKQQLRQIESSEMSFLRSVAGCRMDKERNTDIRQELNIFNVGKKVKTPTELRRISFKMLT